jgi:hypothetical protein
MPLARIVTRRPADAAALAGYLHRLGYVVEVVSPGSAKASSAELDVEVERVPASQALKHAARLAKENSADVLLAPGALQQLFPPAQAPEARPAAAPARPPAFDRFAATLRPVFGAAGQALHQAQVAIRNLLAASRPRLARAYERGHERALALSVDLSQRLKRNAVRLHWPRLGSLPQEARRARLRSRAGAWLARAHDLRLALRRDAVLAPRSYRDLQWRKAAVTSSAVALIAIIGLASVRPRNPASEPSPVVPRNAEAQEVAQPAPSPASLAASLPEEPEEREPVPQADLPPPLQIPPSAASVGAPARRHPPNAERSQPDDVADDVIIRHFRPAPRRDTAEALPEVKRFSDLD